MTHEEIAEFPLWKKLRCIYRVPAGNVERLYLHTLASSVNGEDEEFLAAWLARFRPGWVSDTRRVGVGPSVILVMTSESALSVALAVSMGSHARLGAGSSLRLLDSEVLELICEQAFLP